MEISEARKCTISELCCWKLRDPETV